MQLEMRSVSFCGILSQNDSDIDCKLSINAPGDTDCKFLWAKFGITYDMVSDEMLIDMKCRRKVSFNPGLSLRDKIIDIKYDLSG